MMFPAIITPPIMILITIMITVKIAVMFIIYTPHHQILVKTLFTFRYKLLKVIMVINIRYNRSFGIFKKIRVGKLKQIIVIINKLIDLLCITSSQYLIRETYLVISSYDYNLNPRLATPLYGIAYFGSWRIQHAHNTNKCHTILMFERSKQLLKHSSHSH